MNPDLTTRVRIVMKNTRPCRGWKTISKRCRFRSNMDPASELLVMAGVKKIRGWVAEILPGATWQDQDGQVQHKTMVVPDENNCSLFSHTTPGWHPPPVFSNHNQRALPLVQWNKIIEHVFFFFFFFFFLLSE